MSTGQARQTSQNQKPLEQRVQQPNIKYAIDLVKRGEYITLLKTLGKVLDPIRDEMEYGAYPDILQYKDGLKKIYDLIPENHPVREAERIRSHIGAIIDDMAALEKREQFEERVDNIRNLCEKNADVPYFSNCEIILKRAFEKDSPLNEQDLMGMFGKDFNYLPLLECLQDLKAMKKLENGKPLHHQYELTREGRVAVELLNSA